MRDLLSVETVVREAAKEFHRRRSRSYQQQEKEIAHDDDEDNADVGLNLESFTRKYLEAMRMALLEVKDPLLRALI